MSEFKGTLGIWTVNEEVQENEHGAKYLSLDQNSFETNCIHVYADMNDDLEKLKADAQLIANAPQMLEMLKEIVKWSKTKDGRFTFTTSAEKGEEIKKLIQQATTI